MTEQASRRTRKEPRFGFYKAGVSRLSQEPVTIATSPDLSAVTNRDDPRSTPNESSTRQPSNRRQQSSAKKNIRYEKPSTEKVSQQRFYEAPRPATNPSQTSSNRRNQRNPRQDQLKEARGGISRQQANEKLYDPSKEDSSKRKQQQRRSNHQNNSNQQQQYSNGELFVDDEGYEYDDEPRRLPALSNQCEMARPSDYANCDDLLHESDAIKTALDNQLSHRHNNIGSKFAFDRLMKTRERLMDVYRMIIMKDITFCNQHTVDQRLWKNVFYHVFEMMRNRIADVGKEDKERERLEKNLIVMLKHASEFYSTLVNQLSSQHRLHLSCFADNNHQQNDTDHEDASSKKPSSKHGKLCLMTCQRMLLSLGDVHRYMSYAKDDNNYGEARRWYTHARTLEPRSGRPYNQLALLAVLTKRSFEAVYFYMRSLATPTQPILTARESLMALFNDSRRKLEYVRNKEQQQKAKEEKNESKTNGGKHSKKNNNNNDQPRGSNGGAGVSHHRWVRPDYASPPVHTATTLDGNHDDKDGRKAAEAQLKYRTTTTSTDDDHHHNHHQQHKLSDAANRKTRNEVFKKFILVFLNVHGVIFTHIASDTFDQLKNESLQLLDKLLEDKTSKICVDTLTHIFVINSYSVHDQSKISEGNGGEGDGISMLRQARSYMCHLTALVCTHACRLLATMRDEAATSSLPTSSSGGEESKAESLLAYIKLAADWLYLNQALWMPRTQEQLRQADDDIRTLVGALASLCDHVSDMVERSAWGIGVSHRPASRFVRVRLREEKEVVGFAPLQATQEEEAGYVDEERMDCMERVNLAVRLDLINRFLQYLCGSQHLPLIAFKQGRYVSLVGDESSPPSSPDSNSTAQSCHQQQLVCTNISDDDEDEENELVDNLADVSIEDHQHHHEPDEIRSLVDYRSQLQVEKQNIEKRKNIISKSLADARGEALLVLRVEPKYLVPDTNCFIDHLTLIQKILKHGYYTVCVPLLVLVELEGLARVCKRSSVDDKHATYVNMRASDSLSFLTQSINSSHQPRKLKVLTNQGSELKNLNFVYEEDGSNARGNNDDMILACSVKLEMKKRSYHRTVFTGGDTELVKHSTVLLTDDRNLRVKAHAHNLPASTLTGFIKWAQL